MEKRRIAQYFDSISVVEGEVSVEYVRRIDKTVQKLAILGGTKDDDNVNVQIVQNLSECIRRGEGNPLSSPGLTRASIEETIRNAYMYHKQNVGNGKGQTKADDPINNDLYAGGAQPAGEGGSEMGRDPKGKLRNERKIQQQQKEQSQQQQQQQNQQQRSSSCSNHSSSGSTRVVVAV